MTNHEFPNGPLEAKMWLARVMLYKKPGGKVMKDMMMRFLREDDGQDLIEYSLLLAFVALFSAALFINVGTAVSTVWVQANTRANQAASAATAS